MSRRIQIHSAHAKADSSVRSGICVECGAERRSSPVGATYPVAALASDLRTMSPLRGLNGMMGGHAKKIPLLTELALVRSSEREGTT